MVNNLLFQCEHEDTAQEIFLLIGLALQLRNEDKLSFVYLGPCFNFNGVDIKKSNTHISYIDRMLRAHSWDTSMSKQSKNLSLFPIYV